MIKILLIAYSFPPNEDPQALRWYYYSRELIRHGLKVDILTINSSLQSTLNLVDFKNTNIYRIFPGPLEYLAQKIKKDLQSENPEMSLNVRSSILFRFLKKNYRIIKKLFNLLLPGDYRTEWFPFAIHFLKRLNKSVSISDRYDIILTSHEPAVDSLIGLYLKKKFKIIWIADFGDPYVCLYTPKIKEHLFERKIERQIYYFADLLIFSNNTVVENLKNKYDFLKKKEILVLYQGFDKEKIQFYQRNDFLDGYMRIDIQNQDRLNLFYAGTFYHNFRDPSLLISVLDKLNKEGLRINLYIAGRNDEYTKMFARYPFIKNLGIIDHESILKSYQLFDVLVCILNNDDSQIPGKLFEYLGTKKPILCIYYREHEEIKSILKKSNAGWYLPYSFDELYSLLRKLFEMKSLNQLSLSFNLSEIEKYSYQFQAKKLIAKLNEIVSNRHK